MRKGTAHWSTAPTYIRAFLICGPIQLGHARLASLRIVGPIQLRKLVE
jgi:hypothetical protein